MLSVTCKPYMLSVVMLNVVMLCVVILNVVMLSVIMLSVVAPFYAGIVMQHQILLFKMRIDHFLKKRNVFNFFSFVSAKMKEVRLNLRY